MKKSILLSVLFLTASTASATGSLGSLTDFGDGYTRQNVIDYGYFRKFNEIIQGLHPEVERETDIVYLVNTSDSRNHCTDLKTLSIPNQHMILLKRVSASRPLFDRNDSGQIIGINADGAQVAALAKRDGIVDAASTPQFKYLHEMTDNDSAYIPVSSGIPNGNKILTYSGIFRVNEERTNRMRKSTNTTSDPMQWSVYIDGAYDNSGNEARLALHGTSKNYWYLLGKQRASSGCIRLQSDFSRWNQALLFDKAANGELVPKAEFSGPVKVWNRKLHLPPVGQKFEQLSTGHRLRVLIIFVDGYSLSCT